MKVYSGAGKLYRRASVPYAITAGIKILALPPAMRPRKACNECRGKGCPRCRSTGKVPMGGGVLLNSRLFVKQARAKRDPGQSAMEGVRPLAPGFEEENGIGSFGDPAVLSAIDHDPSNPPPTGSARLLVRLAAIHPLGTETSPPAFNQHLRAYKLGVGSGHDFRRDPSLEEGAAGKDRDRHPEPSGGPECVGDGKRATRWMAGSRGWDHYEIPCPDEDCPFSGPGGACSPNTTLSVATRGGLARYESKGVETGAGFLGLFGTRENPGSLVREAAELGITSLYYLPLALDISTKSKAGGQVRYGGKTITMRPRRYPVVDISVVGSLAEFWHEHERLLRPQIAVSSPLALPPLPTEDELRESDSDLLVVPAEVSTKPAEEEPPEPTLYEKIGSEFKGRLTQREIKTALEDADLKAKGKRLAADVPWNEVRKTLNAALADKARAQLGGAE